MVFFSQFQKLFRIETKRLILVVGVVFSVIIVVQYSSFNILSLLNFKYGVVDHSTFLNSSISTDSSMVPGVVSNRERNSRLTSIEKGSNNSFDSSSKESQQGLSMEEVQKPDNKNSSLALTNVSSEQNVVMPQPVAATSNLTFSQSCANSSKTDAFPLQTDLGNSTEDTIVIKTAKRGNRTHPPTTISEMSNLLLQSRVSSHGVRPRWSSGRDQELLSAKLQIESAPIVGSDAELYAPLYRNLSMFKRSYELMQNTFKVYIYKEGEKPIFHQPKLKGIYASEGWFMKLIEGNKQFVVKDPAEAHMFYLPFSALMLRLTLYVGKHKKNQVEFLKNYVNLIAGKYPFWNRTGGADHFLVASHDWAPQNTIKYMGTCIRALSNANVARSFKIGKDVSFPVTVIHNAADPLRSLGGKPPSQRPFLAFFAGKMHGYVRPILLQYWQNKDPDMKIFGPLPRKGKLNYIEYMKSSKYCICARGYEVHTPRVVEAIFHECVPVIISDNYVPPFFEILNWEAFSVFVLEEDIPNLKQILLSIPERRYLELQKRVKKVQKHFLWHKDPVNYDIFHMTLHSIWYNRVFQIKAK